jgi:hypothetical protein
MRLVVGSVSLAYNFRVQSSELRTVGDGLRLAQIAPLEGVLKIGCCYSAYASVKTPPASVRINFNRVFN